MMMSSTTKNGGVKLVFNDLEGPKIIEDLEAGSVIGGSCCFLSSFSALSQQMTSSPAPDSSTLRTPGSLEDLASLCQQGRGDLSCTWGLFGVQLVFFSGMQIQMSSMCKDRGVICSQGGIYV